MASTGPAVRRGIPRWLRTLVAIVAFAGVAAWLTQSTWDNIKPTRQDLGFQTDFRDAVYYPVVAFTDGANPYNPGEYYRSYPVGQEFPLYSPVHLVLHLPLAALSLPRARATYFGLNLALILLLAGFSLRLAGYRGDLGDAFALGTLLLLTGAGRLDLRNGEPTLLIVLACYLALAARASHPGRAATGVAVALLKPTFGVPLAIVLLCRRRIRAALIGVAAATVVSAFAVIPLAQAAGGVGSLIDSLRDDLRVTSRSFQSRLGSPLRLDAANSLARLTGIRPSEAAATAFGLALLGLGMYAIWLLHSHDPDGDRRELAVTLACLVILVPIFRVGYDLLLLNWPILLLVRRHPRDAIWPGRLRIVLAVLLLVPIVDPLSWSFVEDVVGRHGIAAHLLGPTAIGLCLLAAFGIACLLALRPVRTRSAVAS
ncbi:MAG: glycosyltransferase family 87 protein [Acidimicrobiia bacterium]